VSSYKSRVEYDITTTGTLTFNFPFLYIQKKFVCVKIRDSSNKETELTYGTDYTVNDLTITLVSAPAVGTTLIIYRQTATDKIVDWNDGSILLATNMTLEGTQLLHLQEEQQDYLTANSIAAKNVSNESVWEGNGKRLSDIADPTDEQDAVTKAYMESVQADFGAQNTKTALQAVDTAKKWAEGSTTPDNLVDSNSSTGLTQSAKSWALYAKAQAENAAADSARVQTMAISTIDEIITTGTYTEPTPNANDSEIANSDIDTIVNN